MQDLPEPMGGVNLQERYGYSICYYVTPLHPPPLHRHPEGLYFQKTLWEKVLDQRKGIETGIPFSRGVQEREGKKCSEGKRTSSIY